MRFIYITRKRHTDAYSCMDSSIVIYWTAGGSWGKLSFSFIILFVILSPSFFANFSHGKNPLSLISHEKVTKYKIRVIEPEISSSIYTVCFSTKIAKERWQLKWNWKASNLCVKNIYIPRPLKKTESRFRK